jgi:uncharacterized phage protein (TIGR01671 family)
MREIKFRAINVKNEIIYGLPYTDGVNETAYFEEYGNRLCWRSEQGQHCNQPYKNGTLMQYTGLLDKNGIEIYEDDIVNLHFEDEYSNDRVSVDGLTTIKVRVKFDYKGVCGEEADSTWYYFSDLISNDVEIEIIGNIYDDFANRTYENCKYYGYLDSDALI